MSARTLSAIFFFITGSVAFAAIAADVAHRGALFQVDRQLAPFLHQHANPVLIFFASVYSGLGDIRILAPFAIIVAFFLVRRRAWRELLVWALGLLGSLIICGTLKILFAVPRPARFTFYPFDPGAGYTFPSGHTMGAAIAAGLLAFLWIRLGPKPRPGVHRLAATALAVLLGAFTAASLVYIGVHFLSDVLGALAISLAWLSLLGLALPPSPGLEQT